MSDIHYLTPALTDDGPSFQAAVEADDGKLTGYTPQLLEAFIDEVIELHPDALVLGGDVTFNGESRATSICRSGSDGYRMRAFRCL